MAAGDSCAYLCYVKWNKIKMVFKRPLDYLPRVFARNTNTHIITSSEGDPFT